MTEFGQPCDRVRGEFQPDLEINLTRPYGKNRLLPTIGLANCTFEIVDGVGDII